MNAGAPTGREIVIGRNSKVWNALARDAAVAGRFTHALSHRQLEGFAFEPGDRVWVFAYSRDPAENSRMLARLEQAHVAVVVYVSSASTIVGRVTHCYEYPRVKAQAEAEARLRLQARILVLGLVHESIEELPAGLNAATSMHSLIRFMLRPEWTEEGGRSRRLFEPLSRPFSGALESTGYRVYGALQRACGAWPCLLRPLDYLLRAWGWRWYGYLYLSNHLWYSTTSSSARA
jgi:hypothetical protein